MTFFILNQHTTLSSPDLLRWYAKIIILESNIYACKDILNATWDIKLKNKYFWYAEEKG